MLDHKESRFVCSGFRSAVEILLSEQGSVGGSSLGVLRSVVENCKEWSDKGRAYISDISNLINYLYENLVERNNAEVLSVLGNPYPIACGAIYRCKLELVKVRSDIKELVTRWNLISRVLGIVKESSLGVIGEGDMVIEGNGNEKFAQVQKFVLGLLYRIKDLVDKAYDLLVDKLWKSVNDISGEVSKLRSVGGRASYGKIIKYFDEAKSYGDGVKVSLEKIRKHVNTAIESLS